MQTTLYQDWTILSGDTTLRRALKKERKTEVVDYQYEQLNTAISCCKQFRTAIDVGANYGVMSYHMSKRFTNVHAFEIEPNVYNCLETNVKHFNLDNVQTHACGLGNKEQTVSLTYIGNKEKSNSQPYKGTSTFGTHVTPDSSGDILVKTMDSFSFTDVDFIKMDAEGFEPLIINGGIDLIAKYKPVILYECKGHETRYGYAKDEVGQQLKKLGYVKIADAGNKKNAIIGVIN